MRVYSVQLDIAWEDKEANYSKVRSFLLDAGVAPGSLVVLPEMFPTGFSMNVDATRESNPSSTEAFLRTLARSFDSFIVAGLVTMNSDGHAYNQAVALSPQGEVLARYSKVHPFTLGGEAACYSAGTDLASFTWNGMIVAPFICYDLRFPELFRSAVRRGAQLFPVIANWPVKREGHWMTLLQARAIENQAYVVGVNRCGKDPKFTYSGRSLIIDPHGTILADAGSNEGVTTADLDLGVVETWRKDFPCLQDMHWVDHG